VDRYHRLAAKTGRYRFLHYALAAALASFQVLVGASAGTAAARALGHASDVSPVRAVILAMAAGSSAWILSRLLHREAGKVVAPVHITITWWRTQVVVVWAVLTYGQSVALNVSWPPLELPWWASGLALCVPWALHAAGSRRRLARWRRGATAQASAASRWRRALQIELISLTLLASAVVSGAWAAQAHGVATLIAWNTPPVLVLGLGSLIGPFDEARSISGSPLPVVGQGWLTWCLTQLPHAWSCYGLAGTAVGFFTFAGATRFILAGVGLVVTLFAAMLVLAVVQKLRVDAIAQAIADGTLVADARFALYIRPFTSDGELRFEPWIAEAGNTTQDDYQLQQEIEAALTCALAPAGIPLIAIGGAWSQHLIQIERADDGWYESFATLSARALVVIGVLGTSEGLLAEIELLRSTRLLRKAVFVMPPWRHQPQLQQQWQAACARARALDLEVPPDDPDGALFALTGEGKLRSLSQLTDTSVDGFRRALAELLSDANPGAPAVAVLRAVVGHAAGKTGRSSLPSPPSARTDNAISS